MLRRQTPLQVRRPIARRAHARRSWCFAQIRRTGGTEERYQNLHQGASRGSSEKRLQTP